jgi:hypothetical protein
MYVVTNLPPFGTGFQTLSKTVFSRMFDPVNIAEPSKGGLGIDERAYFNDNYYRDGRIKSFTQLPRYFDNCIGRAQ